MNSVSLLRSVFAAAVLIGCDSPIEATDRMHPQSIVLLVTPKMIRDFNRPEADVNEFFRHYNPLTSKAAETVVIFAVGNSDHIRGYRGIGYWNDSIEWARTTDFIPISDATLDYNQLDRIVKAFRAAAAQLKIELKVFDHIDSGSEFTLRNDFKYVRHPECTANKWGMYDIRGSLEPDDLAYATAPQGIEKGTTVATFSLSRAQRMSTILASTGSCSITSLARAAAGMMATAQDTRTRKRRLSMDSSRIPAECLAART